MILNASVQIDLLEQPKGVYLTGATTTISRLANGTTVPSAPFTVTGTGVEVEIASFDFSVNGAPFVPVLPQGVTYFDNIVTINPALVTFKTLAIRASAADTTYRAVFTVTVVQDGYDGNGILSVQGFYLVTPVSSGVTHYTPGWKMDPAEAILTDTNKFLWFYELISYTNGGHFNTPPAIIGIKSERGTPGDGVKHRFRLSAYKPSKPVEGVLDPPGWNSSPDYSLSIDSVTGWALENGWYRSPKINHNESTKTRLTFTVSTPQTVIIQIWGDSEANYDWMIAGNINSELNATFTNYKNRVSGGDKAMVTYEAPAGESYIELAYKKDNSASAFTDAGYFLIVPVDTVWITTCEVLSGAGQEWSDPARFINDTPSEERVYCLSETDSHPAISESNPHADDYIPMPFVPSDHAGQFMTNTAYPLGKVVDYLSDYYRVIKAVPSNYSGNPTNKEYFRLLKKWTDNPSGPTLAYPYEFIAIRKKNAGLWGEWNISGWNHYAKDGPPGESAYMHFRYSNDGGTTFTENDGKTPGSWIGVYSDNNPNDSNDPSDYIWSKTKGDDGTNFLNMGVWSNLISYKKTELGTPFVRVPDGTSLGYSVYSLNVDSSTAGQPPAGSSEWRLMESTAFIYMQQAYIEKLQAMLVTAERIESIMIRTANIEILEGAIVKGTLQGVSGSFKYLNCVNGNGDIVGTITFGSDGRIWFNGCSLMHQAATGPFYASDVWIRGVAGIFTRTAIAIKGSSYGYVYPDGLGTTGSYISLTSGTDSSGNTYRNIPLYSPTSDTSGMPVDLVVINHSSSARYNLPSIPGKKITLINSADQNSNIYIYINGVATQVHGGLGLELTCVGDEQTPANSNRLGNGWLITGYFDNQWT